MSRLLQIKASAGSGKTFTLTSHFTRLLAGCGEHAPRGRGCALLPENAPAAFEDIIAVTFTNAAASEMRARVIERLKKSALGLEADSALPPEKAARWLDGLFMDFGRLNIRTLDSLMSMIVGASALDLDLPPDFGTVFSTDEVLVPYLELIINQAFDGEGTEEELLRKACEALVYHSPGRGFSGGGKLKRNLREFFDDALRGELEDIAEPDALRPVAENLAGETAAMAEALLEKSGELGLGLLANAKKALQAVAEGDLGRDSSYYGKSGFLELLKKSGRPDSLPPDVEELYGACMRSLRDARECSVLHEQALRYHPFIRLARVLCGAYKENSSRENQVPGLLIPELARRALESPNGVSEAICRLGNRLTHFLVDEFQDTSRQQWGVLRQLAREALSRGGSLTWVGDVKQSIYGWRGADPDLFDEILSDSELAGLVEKPETNRLEKNWRSSGIIVGHTNRIFSTLASPDLARKALASILPATCPDCVLDRAAAKLARTFADTAQDCAAVDAPGLVRAESLPDEDDGYDQSACRRLVRLVRDELAGRHRWSDILVLVRKGAQAALAAEALIGAGIPVVTENSLRLACHPLIIQSGAFLALLENPEDDLAAWTVLTGSIFMGHPLAGGLGMERLHALAMRRRPGQMLLEFKGAFPRLWADLLGPFDSQAGLLTPYDAIMEWYRHMEVERRFPSEKIFLRRFMEVVERAEEQGLNSITDFLEYWAEKGREEKTPMPEVMDAVRIMTVHKAKGLEAPAVVVPWSRLDVLAADRIVFREVAGHRVALPNSRACGDEYYEDLARQALESLNVLYVAFTRPRGELHVFCSGGKKGDVLPLLAEWAGLDFPYELGRAGAAPAAGNMRHDARRAESPGTANPDSDDQRAGSHCGDSLCGENQRRENQRGGDVPLQAAETAGGGTQIRGQEAAWRPMDWLPRLRLFRHRIESGALSAETRGTFLHCCLEHMRITGRPDADAMRALNFGLVNSGINVPDNPATRRSLLEPLAWVASLPQSGHWLRAGLAEQSITDGSGRVMRVDLLLRMPGKTLVLDYKSGSPDGKNTLQMRAYLRCLRACEPDNELLGLIIYMDAKRFQLIDAETAGEPVALCPLPPDWMATA